MIRLLRTELRRNFSRRLLKVVALLALLVVALTATISFFNYADDSEARLRAERATICPPDLQPAPEAEGSSPPEGACVVEPRQAKDYQFSYSILGAASRSETIGASSLQITLPMLTLLAFLLGASFIGAEWRAGTMTSFLTWEPRRLRVAVTRLIAAAIVAVLFALFVELLVRLAMLPVAYWRGNFDGLTGTWVNDSLLGLLRNLLIISGAAILGGSVALIGRNTTAALAVGFAYFAVLENILRLLIFGLWKRPGLSHWLLGDNIGAAVGSPEAWNVLSRTEVPAWGRLTLYVGIVAIVAVVLFRRRDLASTT